MTQNIDPKLMLYIALGLGAVYVVSKAAGAAGAVGSAIASGAKTADDAVAGAVGGVGSVFGLPTPGETIDDPAVVRWIIDTRGYFEGSKWGTAIAFLRALNMPAGSGHPMAGPAAPVTASQESPAGVVRYGGNEAAGGSFSGGLASDPFSFDLGMYGAPGAGSIYSPAYGRNLFGDAPIS